MTDHPPAGHAAPAVVMPSPGARAQPAIAVADAVRRVPGVATLSGGPGLPIATLYAGGKVDGVRLTDAEVEVHIVLDSLPLAPVVAAVRAAAEAALSALDDRRVVIVAVEDLIVDHLPSTRHLR